MSRIVIVTLLWEQVFMATNTSNYHCNCMQAHTSMLADKPVSTLHANGSDRSTLFV
jgi:hypothetical protein